MTTQEQKQLLRTQNIYIQGKYHAFQTKPINLGSLISTSRYWNGKEFTWSKKDAKHYTKEQELINDLIQHIANHL